MPNPFLDAINRQGAKPAPTPGNPFLSALQKPTVPAEIPVIPAPVVPPAKPGVLDTIGGAIKKSGLEALSDTKKVLGGVFDALSDIPFIQEAAQGLNVIEQETGKEPTLIKALEIPQNIVKGATSNLKSAAPYAGEIYDIAQISKLHSISTKAKKGEASTEELAWAKDYIQNVDEEARRHKEEWGYSVGSIIKGSAQFALEILGASLVAPITGGGSIVSLIAEKGAIKAAKTVALKIVADKAMRSIFLKEIGQYAAGAGIRAAISSSTRIPLGTVERMTGTPLFNEQGDFTGLAEDGQELSEALINSASSALVEYSSEFSGGAFTLLGQGAKTALIKAGFIKAVLKANPSITPSLFRQVVQRAGWNGVIQEWGEERVADAMYIALHEAGLSDQTFNISWRQVAEEIASFALMGSAISGIDKALGGTGKALGGGQVEKGKGGEGGGGAPPRGEGGGGGAPPSGAGAVGAGEGKDEIDILIEEVRAQMDAGASPAEVALTLSQEMPIAAAEAIVKEAVFESVKQPAVEIVQKEVPQEEIRVDEKITPTGEGAKKAVEEMAALSAKVGKEVLTKTPAQIQDEFNAAQEALAQDTQEIKESIKAIEERLAVAPARSQEKKDIKLELEAERKKLKEAEEDFQNKVYGNSIAFREFLISQIQEKVSGTDEQIAELADEVALRVNDTAYGTKAFDVAISEIMDIVVAESDLAKPTKKAPVKKEVGTRSFEVGDVIDTHGKSNMVGDATVISIEKRSIRFKDSEGKEYAAFDLSTAKKLLQAGEWSLKEGGEKKQKEKPIAKKREIKTARDAAIDLIRAYVERGDTIESLKAGQQGTFGEEYSAQIGGYVNGKNVGNNKILVSKLHGKELAKPEIFSLKELYDEIKKGKKTQKEQKITKDIMDERANALFVKRHGQEAYDEGVKEGAFGLERIEQNADEYDEVFLEEHPELVGVNIIVYHDAIAGDDWAVLNTETGEFVEVFEKELLKPIAEIEAEEEIEIGDVWQGKAYRVETGFTHEAGATAADVVRYEQDELGNDLSADEETLSMLAGFPATATKWVTQTKEEATRYGEEVSEIDVEGWKVVAEDGDGGFLVLDTTIKKEDNKGYDKDTNNRGGGTDGGDISETLPVGGEEPGGAGRTTEVAGRRNANRPAKRGGELGKRPATRLTNEEVEKAVTSVTEILDNGEIMLTGEITDEILDAANQYTPGGAAKEGRGILDEYYTEQQVVDMVKSLIDFPAKDLRVIEPAVGTGNFLYAIPEIGNHQVAALEINPTTARITKIFHPSVKVINKAFETLFITERGERILIEPVNQADLVIGNPPYGEHRGKYLGLGEEKGIKKYEDYFIKRGLDMLKEGGTLAMVVPSSYLDRKGEVKNATLEVAYRLPEGIFKGTQIGTDIVVFKKKLGASGRVMGYFTNNPQNILGEIKEHKNRFGKMEKYIEGDLDSALALFEQHRNDSEAKNILKELKIEPTAENIEEAGEAIEEAGEGAKELIKEGEKAEQRAGKKTIAKKVVKEAVKKTDSIVPLTAQFADIPEAELELWRKTNAQGFVDNPTDEDKKSLNLYNGKWYLDFNYLQGDVYDKLNILKMEELPAGQKLAQKKKLESVLPKPETIKDIKLSPNHTFIKELKVGEETMRSAFLAWIQELPRQAFGDSSNWEVRGYVDNDIVNGSDKDRNELIRKRRKATADALFKKYLQELDLDTQRLFEYTYNRTFNFYHTPDYSKVPMFSEIYANFKGKKLVLNTAQREGIGRLVNRGVGLLAHEVGFGKTISGVLAAYETMKRGWATRSVIIAPNENILNQWAKTIQDIIPNAQINVLGNLGISYKGDLSALKIPEGSFTLLTYEGLKRLSFKDETYERMAGKFQYIADDLSAHKSKRGEAKSEEEAKGTAGAMKKGTRADLFFEDLGFDHFTFDEVHNANHIVSRAKIEKGQASEYSRFAIQPSDLGIKTWLASQYIQEKMNGRNISLLSATPFTNHPLEYYSVLSLVADKSLQRMGLQNVNDFFGVFMEANHEYEFKADGSYKPKTDIRSIRNYRQWKNLLGAYIDFKQDAPGIKRPNRVQMTYEVPQNKLTQEMNVKAQSIFEEKESEQGKGAKVLRAINEFRKIAFSPYASKFSEDVKPESFKEIVENSPKLATVMGIVAQNKKDAPKAGQIIYSEVGVDFFPLLKNYLVKVVGFKSDEVEIITGKTPKPTRIAIQDKFNAGEVKVLIGSEAISEGMNLQENTTDLHLLSLPWNFTALRQVIGRAWRQGNGWSNVRVNQYFIQDSIDVFLSQKLDNKQRRYEAAIASDANEIDVGDVSYNEMKGELIRDPERRAKFEIEARKEKLKADIMQAQAELAFATRKLEKINDLLEKIKDTEESLKTEKEEYWIDRYNKTLKEAKKDYAEELAKLKAKDIDVEDLLKKRTEGEAHIAELEAQEKDIEATFETRVKEIASSLPQRQFFSQDILDKFVAERAEHNKTFYHIAETPVEETVSVEAQVKEIKNAAGTKVVKTKKTTKVVKKVKEVPKKGGTKDQRVLSVLANRELDVAQKVNEILNVKQEGKEFKDTGERVAGSKKERAAINTVLENGDAAVIAEMIKTLGADAIADTLHKDEILEDAVKPDVEQDKANKVPAFITGWKQKVFNSIGRTPTLVSKEGKWRSSQQVPEKIILPFLTNYGNYLRSFVKELSDVKNNEQAQAFKDKYRWDFVDSIPAQDKEQPNYAPGVSIGVLGRTIKSAIGDIQPYTRILQDIVDLKKILAEGVQISTGWSDGKPRYDSVNEYGEGTRSFKTKEEAEADLKENRAEAEEKMLKREERLQNDYDYYLPKKKIRDDNVDLSHANFKPLERVERSEPDIPDEKINPETLTKEMGFKSAQFGNYMDDPTSKEHIRYTIGAVKDMSKIFGIDFPLLFNKVKLSIAFGARGGGRFNAHYEPHHNIINLTKGRGDGSFFHEIIHGLDFTTNRGGYRKKWSSGLESWSRGDELDQATMYLTRALSGDMIRKVKEFKPREDSYILDDKENWAMRARAEGRTFESVVEEAKRRQYTGRAFQEVADVYRKPVAEETDIWHEPTAFYLGGKALGGGKTTSYWVRDEELLARAGQAYLEDKMIAAGIKNNYLTRTTISDKEGDYLSKAYPQGEERKIFAGYFDRVFAELAKRYALPKDVEELPSEPRFKLTDLFRDRNKPRVNMTVAGMYLDDVKQRLNFDFDVYFTDSILAQIKGEKRKAWGMAFDDTITLVKEMAKYAAPHEVVHLTLENMDRIPIFSREGLTRMKVVREKAKQMGIKPNITNNFTKEQYYDIHEKLAEEFEKYLDDKYEPNGIIRKFFALLKRALLRLARVINDTRGDIIKDYYDILDEGVALEEDYIRIENDGIVETFINEVGGDVIDVGAMETFAKRQGFAKEMRFKLIDEKDKRMQNLKGRFNDIVNKQSDLEQNAEAWKTDLMKEVITRADAAKAVSEAKDERVTGKFGEPGIIKFTKRTPPVGELTERGEQEVESLGFENVEEAQQAINDYLQRKVQLVDTRNKLRELRRQIAGARKDKKLNQAALRDIERKLKLRKRYLESKDLYVGMGIGRGKKEQMKMIHRRGRVVSNIQQLFSIGDKKAKDIIGGIGKQRIHLMTEKQFDDFVVEFYNRAEKMHNQLTAQEEVQAIIAEQQYSKWENLQKAMGFPSLTKMTEQQAQQFLDVLSRYQFGDVFLTQRDIETVHRTDWGEIKTERELLGKIKEKMGFGVQELKTLSGRNVSEYTSWIRLARKHPFYNWLIGKRVEAVIQSEREYTAIEEEINHYARAARHSRRVLMGLGERAADVAVPTDDIVFGYLEAENKEKYAKDKGMTAEELAFAAYLTQQYYNAYEYLNSEYGMRERKHYMTHIRRSFFEALKEEGIMPAFRETLASHREEEAAFKILDDETGNTLAFEKFFGFALRRSGALVPSKNVVRSSLSYFHALSKKRALDKFIPEAMIAVQAHKAVVGTTEKGLTKDPTLEKFVKEFLNDAKGRKIKFITRQGSSSDILIRALVSWTAIKYLGANLAPAIGNVLGDFTAIFWELSIREQAQGIVRSAIHPLQAHEINKQFRYFTGRNPIVELFDARYGLPERLKKSLMTLMGIASFQTHKFFLRAKMTDEEFRTGVLEDARLKDIALSLARVKPNKFYVKSLAGNTTVGNATFQFGTWAIAITNTILSDGQEVLKLIAARDPKKIITSREAQKLLKFAIMAGILVWLTSLIEVDDDDYTLWGRTVRSIKQNLNTLVEALKFTTDITNYALIIKEIMLWGTALKQIYTQEQYKTDGVGYEIGDPKWIRTGKRIITPSMLRQFLHNEKGNAKESRVQEAIASGQFNAEEIAKAISPDWNDPEKMDEEAKRRKVDSVEVLYAARKYYPGNQVIDIILNGDNNEERAKTLVEKGIQLSDVQKLYRDSRLCADPKKKTGCLVSGKMLKEYLKARRK